jgi:hypothetical protein
MFGAFDGQVREGHVVVPELEEHTELVEGHKVTIIPLKYWEAGDLLAQGSTVSGIYRDGRIENKDGEDDLLRFEDQDVVLVLHRKLPGGPLGALLRKGPPGKG